MPRTRKILKQREENDGGCQPQENDARQQTLRFSDSWAHLECAGISEPGGSRHVRIQADVSNLETAATRVEMWTDSPMGKREKGKAPEPKGRLRDRRHQEKDRVSSTSEAIKNHVTHASVNSPHRRRHRTGLKGSPEKTPLSPAFRKLRQVALCESEASLLYIVSSRTARNTD